MKQLGVAQSHTLESHRAKRVSVLAVVDQLCTMVATTTDADQTLRAVLEQCMKAFPWAEAGMLFEYRQGPDRLLVHSSAGYDSMRVKDVSLKPDEPIAGSVLQSGQVAILVGVEQVRDALSGMSLENRARLQGAVRGCEYPKTVLCVPLICGDVRIGALSLESWHSVTPILQAEIRIAETLARLCSVIIDRVHAIREREHAKSALDQASRLQQEVLSTLSHEMRTPLASIKGYASALLLEEMRWDEQTVREYLEVIVEESDNLAEITADLLDVSMIDAGRLEISREPTILPRLAQDTVEEISRYTDHHRFLVTFPPGFPIVDADAGRIRRLLHNLLDNAVKYSSGGLVVVRGEVRENEVLVSVADQGPGIAPEHLNRLFERFFRVKFVSGRHVVGSGLGLPIARDIVEAHGGRIWAESKPGEGTTISFTLPLGGLSRGIAEGED